jgi:hypothetical protein
MSNAIKKEQAVQITRNESVLGDFNDTRRVGANLLKMQLRKETSRVLGVETFATNS